MAERLNFLDISACFKICKNCFSCFKSCHSRIFTAVKNFGLILRCLSALDDFICSSLVSSTCHMTVISESAYNRKVMTKSYLKVIRIVSRSNFYNACSLCHIRMLITYNRNFLVEQRKNDMAAVQMRISWVITIDCNSSISKHCFRSCGSKLKFFACFLNCIEKMPEIGIL